MFEEEEEWEEDKGNGGISKALVKQSKKKAKLKAKGIKKVQEDPCSFTNSSQPKCTSAPPTNARATPTDVRSPKHPPVPSSSSVIPRVSKLQTKMTKRLSGARFRWINEKLYTCTGDDALRLFADSPDLFEIYHSGFSDQVSKWPRNPLDGVIEYVKALPKSHVIADFGCGDARLAQSVPHLVHSFDLVAVNDHVTACNMSRVPLKDSSVDVVVFCLSLMNLETIQFIIEARRVLKVGGILKICEIKSRIESIREFVSKIKECSFSLEGKPRSLNKLFVDFNFTLKNKKKLDPESAAIHLNPCLYKKR